VLPALGVRVLLAPRAAAHRLRGKAVRFADKLTQAQGLIERLARCFAQAPLLVV